MKQNIIKLICMDTEICSWKGELVNKDGAYLMVGCVTELLSSGEQCIYAEAVHVLLCVSLK